MIFGSPHAILNNHFSSTEKQFKILLHRRRSLHRALVITRYEQRSFVVASFFASTCTFHGPCPAFLGFNGPSMIRSFPLLQESPELRFRFRHKMFVKSEPSPLHMQPYLLSGDQFKIQTSFVLFCPPEIVNFRLKLFVHN